MKTSTFTLLVILLASCLSFAQTQSKDIELNKIESDFSYCLNNTKMVQQILGSFYPNGLTLVTNNNSVRWNAESEFDLTFVGGSILFTTHKIYEIRPNVYKNLLTFIIVDVIISHGKLILNTTEEVSKNDFDYSFETKRDLVVKNFPEIQGNIIYRSNFDPTTGDMLASEVLVRALNVYYTPSDEKEYETVYNYTNGPIIPTTVKAPVGKFYSCLRIKN